MRGVDNANRARRKQIKFPDNIEMQPGDRVYGIDATRSSLITSYGAKHRGDVDSASNLVKDKRASPLMINPLNDSYIRKAKGFPELAEGSVKKFKREASRYHQKLDQIPEVQTQIDHVKTSGDAVRKDNNTRRKTFGLLSKAGINFAHQERKQIFYGLDDMALPSAFDPSAPHYPTVSSQEIRHIHANLDVLVPNTQGHANNTVRFIRNGQEVTAHDVFQGIDATHAQRRPSYGELNLPRPVPVAPAAQSPVLPPLPNAQPLVGPANPGQAAVMQAQPGPRPRSSSAPPSLGSSSGRKPAEQ